MEQSVKNSFLETSNVNKMNLDELVGLVEELVINKVRIEKIKSEITNNSHGKILDQELRIITEIQASIKKVRLIKIKTITNSLTDLVNQCLKEKNLKADFVFEGQETEVENSIISYVHNIMNYLIKNICENEFSITKDEGNRINVTAFSDGKNLTTIIESNGQSFNYDETCKKLNKGNLDLLTFSEDEMKIFLDTVRITNNIEELLKLRTDLIYLDGSMEFEARENEYRRVTIGIPLSSSIMQGMLVTVGTQTYAIPLEYIETIMNTSTIKTQKFQDNEMMIYLDHVIRLVRVSNLLNVETTGESACVLIVSANNRRVALMVDSLLDQTDMVTKPKHSIIADITEIKGSTILGDGLVTLVLDIPSIVKGE